MTKGSIVKQRFGEYASSVLIVASLFLGWQIIREVGAQRLPVGMAIRLSPTSPAVLARAAEAELVAKRYENAADLANESLARAPFNARALRVAGLALASTGGDVDDVEQIITQAGNWSLRDDPAHAWLVERLLRKGDYGSAFAHADTLARRRADLWPKVFDLYKTAGVEDPRALSVLTSLMATKPPWREEFFNYLSRSPDGLNVSATLAVALERTDAPVTSDELGQLYIKLLHSRMLPGMALVRKALGRPPVADEVVGGSFPLDGPTQPAPFGWEFPAASGVVSDILPDDIRSSETALRVQYDGYAVSKIADQFIQLDPGHYRLTGEARTEFGEAEGRLAWMVICVETDTIISKTPSADWPANAWTRFHADFRVPDTNCSAQWLRLEPVSANQRSNMAVWYDRLSIAPLDVGTSEK